MLVRLRTLSRPIQDCNWRKYSENELAANYGCLNCSDSVSIPEIIRMAWRIPIPLRIGLITGKEQVETESGPPSSEEFLEAQVRAGVLGTRTYRKSKVLPLLLRGTNGCSLDQRFGRAWSSSDNAMLDLFVHDSTNAMNHKPCRLRKPSHTWGSSK
jgi:hypothetical protein